MKFGPAFFALIGAAFAADDLNTQSITTTSSNCNNPISLTSATETFPYAPVLQVVPTDGISTNTKQSGLASTNQLRIAFLVDKDVAGRVMTFSAKDGCTSSDKIKVTKTASDCSIQLLIDRADLKNCFTETVTTTTTGSTYSYAGNLKLDVTDTVSPVGGTAYTRKDTMTYPVSITVVGSNKDVNKSTEQDVTITPEWKVTSQTFNPSTKTFEIGVTSEIEWPFQVSLDTSKYSVAGLEALSPFGQQLGMDCPQTPNSKCLQNWSLLYRVNTNNCNTISSQALSVAYASCRQLDTSKTSCHVDDSGLRTLGMKIQSDSTCSTVSVSIKDVQPEMIINSVATSLGNTNLLRMTDWYIHITTTKLAQIGQVVTIPNLYITAANTNEKLWLVQNHVPSALALRDWNKWQCNNVDPTNTYCRIFASIDDPDFWKEGLSTTPGSAGSYGILQSGKSTTYTFHADLEYQGKGTAIYRRHLVARADVSGGSATRNVTLDASNYVAQFKHDGSMEGSSSGGLGAGAIGGIVAAGLVAVGAVVGGSIMHRRRKAAAAGAKAVEEIKA
ncbi:hypothetical protein HDV00_008515 [Rhizophlyctis rosea]|nr:hypothetical protein HDV00_008515 [Rhizophlyctis rosea]